MGKKVPKIFESEGVDIGTLQVRDEVLHDVYETEDYTRYTLDGNYRYICHESGKRYKSLNALRGSQRLRQYWKDVEAGIRERPRRPPKRSRNSNHAAPDTVDSYVVPKTSGPIFEYIRRNMPNFGVGIIPDEWPSRPTQGTVAEECVQLHSDLMRVVRELYGDEWRALMRSIGCTHEMIKYLERPADVNTKNWRQARGAQESIVHIRQVSLLSLVHIYNIMETLRELERELWVTLQRSHDTRLIPKSDRVPYKSRVAKAKASLGRLRTVPDPQHAWEVLLMPTRVRIVHQRGVVGLE